VQPGAVAVPLDPELADEPGEGPVSQLWRRLRDLLAQVQGIGQRGEVVGGEDLRLFQDGAVGAT
jgi:hypothetical protein